MTSIHRNISFAAAASFRDILASGNYVAVRGKETKEILNQVTVIERPHERFLFLPDRLNDCFAQIAESLWVLAGRDDIEWLTRYLPRAPNYSDDGKTWRAGYGPRLRRWHGKTDQVDKVRKLLLDDQSSRRAVMGLFDPQKDFVDSRDIPCNNLLSWLIRDGQLHLSVVLRSNDAMWGFSGANAFEWSVLHELMAKWLGTDVGTVTFFAASFHLYEEHWDRSQRISSKFQGATPYEHGVPGLPLDIKWEAIEQNLKTWFELEELVRRDPFAEISRLNELDDAFLRMSLQTIRLYWLDKRPRNEVPNETFSSILGGLKECDLVAAAYEFFGRARSGLLHEIPHPHIAAYFAAISSGKLDDEMNSAIKKLHSAKDRAYGGAWKKRGELVSVMANIARKVDRLVVYVTSRHDLVGETILDTAVDLFVYSGKYQLFLEDMDPGDLLSASAPRPFSDHDENFDTIADRLIASEPSDEDADTLIGLIAETFERLWHAAADSEPVEERKTLAAELTEESALLVGALRKSHPDQTASFIRAATT
ncbi:thymidylate synthase [Rhizobium leguminosarum]|uniref:thymidylate synthase n=1 Tax=Rhizobium leguminosarum TaxID=384 RepID=UPI003F99003F